MYAYGRLNADLGRLYHHGRKCASGAHMHSNTTFGRGMTYFLNGPEVCGVLGVNFFQDILNFADFSFNGMSEEKTAASTGVVLLA